MPTEATTTTTSASSQQGAPATATAPAAGTSTAATAPATAGGATQQTGGQLPLLGQQASGDSKQGQDAGSQGQGQAKADTAAPAELVVKLPDGVEAGAVLLDDFKSLAKEAGLTSESAQKIVDHMVKLNQRYGESAAAHWGDLNKQWVETARTDKEFGGPKFAENLAVAQKAVNQFGGEALNKFLNESGLGNHPDLIRAFYRAGKAISEDSIAGKTNGAPARGAEFAPVDLYPSMQPKSAQT